MNFLNNITTVSRRGFSGISRNVEQLSFGFSSFVKKRNLNHLNHSLLESLRSSSRVQQDLRIIESHFMEATQDRLQLAQELLTEERNWKSKLLAVQKRQDDALNRFRMESSKLSIKINLARERLACGTLEDTDHSTFDRLSLEEDMSRVRDAKSVLIGATQELDSLREKPAVITEIANRLRNARNHQHMVSIEYHAVKSDFDHSKKQLNQVNHSIQFVSQSQESDSVWSQLLNPRFWRHAVQAFVPAVRR